MDKYWTKPLTMAGYVLGTHTGDWPILFLIRFRRDFRFIGTLFAICPFHHPFKPHENQSELTILLCITLIANTV